MKLCNSPPSTRCMYQRIARDQAPDANGAQAGASSQAYTDLYQHLEGSNDDEALVLLAHLMNCLTNGGAMDEPMPFSGRPVVGGGQDPTTSASRGAMDSAIRRGKAQAQQYLFAKRFPGASRIRVVG